MSQDHFKIDDNQFNSIIEVLKKEHVLGFPVDSLSRIAQTIAFIVAGAWVVFIYFTHESEKHELEITQLELEKKTLQASQLAKLSHEASLEISKTRIGSDNYATAELNIELENTSSKQHDVSWSVIEYFSGKLDNKNDAISVLNPPKPFHLKKEWHGDVAWERVGHYLHFAKHFTGEERKKAEQYLSKHGIEVKEETNIEGGGLTGFYSPSSKNWVEQRYLIPVPSSDLFGVSIVIGVDGGNEIRKHFFYTFEELVTNDEDANANKAN